MFSILLPLIYLAFISLGLPDALLGSAWPTMYPILNVPVSYAGVVTMIIVKMVEGAGMDGKGQCLDNARTERFFRTLKYERIYINEYETPRQLRAMIKDYIHTYNTYRPHSSINGECPANLYSGVKEQVIAS